MAEPSIDIRHLRERLNWSQEQLAQFLGLDRSSVSRMENGQPPKGPTLKLLLSLSEHPEPSPDEARA